jgi:uncharacterized protein involved in cysteine biosynthesis
MNVAKSLWASIQTDPTLMVRLHGWLTLMWLVATPFIILFLSDSVQFIVLISVYAVITGHWSSWQAARVEVKQDEQTR